MYPIVEAITGAMFLGGYLLYGPSPLLVVRLLFGCAMIVLFVIDLQHKILPNVITLPGIAAGLLLSEVAGPGWKASLLGALLGGGVLWLIAEVYYRVRHQEGLGMGDVKMLAMVGAFLGWKLMLLTMVLASFSGTIVGIGVLVAKKESLKYALPFGTFLAIGAIVAAAVGDQIVAWYLGLY
ncbi:MAG TPA: A24 family peptidase, partial [Vicinamibacterales bacterium]|nr:A24 family peptidase [Vicinamibacterales bacterium]